MSDERLEGIANSGNFNETEITLINNIKNKLEEGTLTSEDINKLFQNVNCNEQKKLKKRDPRKYSKKVSETKDETEKPEDEIPDNPTVNIDEPEDEIPDNPTENIVVHEDEIPTNPTTPSGNKGEPINETKDNKQNESNKPKKENEFNNQISSEKLNNLNEILNIINNKIDKNNKDIQNTITSNEELLQQCEDVITEQGLPPNGYIAENQNNNKYILPVVISITVFAIFILASLFFLKNRGKKRNKQRDIESTYSLPKEDVQTTQYKSDTPNEFENTYSSPNLGSTPQYNNSPNMNSSIDLKSPPQFYNSPNMKSPNVDSPNLRSSIPPISTQTVNSINNNLSNNINYPENLVNRNFSSNIFNNDNVNIMPRPVSYNNSNNILNNNSIVQNNVNNYRLSAMSQPNNVLQPNNMPQMNTMVPNNSSLPNNNYNKNNITQSNVQGDLPALNNNNNNTQPVSGNNALPSYIDSVTQKAKQNEHVFTAQYYYNPAFNDEFQISPGDVISFGQCTYDDGWAHGNNLTKNVSGVFPLGVVIKIVDVDGKNKDPYQISEKYKCKPRTTSHTVKYQASTSEKDPKFEKNSLELNYLLGKLSVEEYLYLNSIERKNIELREKNKDNSSNANDNANHTTTDNSDPATADSNTTTEIKSNDNVNSNNTSLVNNNVDINNNNNTNGSGSSSSNDAGSSESSNNNAGSSGSNNNNAGSSGSGSSNAQAYN